eukprot:TRINITY_DN12026_c0_g2_i2.p1 TRINITY_DN12026_c0_g2~~TRINITY_DN12026_c0_g2_i2.p1  ORF type:complete len:158 (+),score=41.69 TRINITY_DN12026_c0_g2_i2:386-859(+)
MSQREMYSLALGILEGASAVTLDKRITDIRKKNLKLKPSEPQDLDEQKPYMCRLEEMRNIAGLNILLIGILKNITNFEKVTELKDYISKSAHFLSESSARMDILEDFLRVHCDFLDIDKLFVEKPTEIKGKTVTKKFKSDYHQSIVERLLVCVKKAE